MYTHENQRKVLGMNEMHSFMVENDINKEKKVLIVVKS